MHRSIRSSILVKRSSEVLFECVTSRAFLRQSLLPSVRKTPAPELEQITQGPVGVGTQFVLSRPGKSQGPETRITVLAYQRPTVFAFEVMMAGSLTKLTWTLKPISEGTVVTLEFGPHRQHWLMKVLSILDPTSDTVPREYGHRLIHYLEDRC